MEIVKKINLDDLEKMSQRMFEPLVKAVVDVKNRTMAVDADLHSDEELLLLESGSKQDDLWGINLWPDKYGTDEFVEFDSMINLRPHQKNYSRGVQNADTRALILEIVNEAVSK